MFSFSISRMVLAVVLVAQGGMPPCCCGEFRAPVDNGAVSNTLDPTPQRGKCECVVCTAQTIAIPTRFAPSVERADDVVAILGEPRCPMRVATNCPTDLSYTCQLSGTSLLSEAVMLRE